MSRGEFGGVDGLGVAGDVREKLRRRCEENVRRAIIFLGIRNNEMLNTGKILRGDRAYSDDRLDETRLCASFCRTI